MPSWALFVLRPLFQYSDWRDAWILRVVGERYGPVLRGPPVRERVPRRRAEPRVWQRRLRRPVAIDLPTAVIIACGIAIAIILGFVIAGSTGGSGSTAALGRPTSIGAVEVSLPSGWQLRPAQKLAPLGLSDGIGAVSGDRWIAVGTATTTDPSLLPASILDSVPTTPVAQLVTLGGTTFYRYLNLSLRGVSGLRSVYAAPSSSGTVLAVCRAPSADAGFASTCQRVVQSIRLRSGSLSPGLVPAYASALTAVIGRLNAARAGLGARLSAALTARAQASLASQLAAAHARAAAALTGLDPGPARSGNAALVTALRTAADAYTALARAAARGQAGAYRRATAAVAQANGAVASALTAIEAFGYRVS